MPKYEIIYVKNKLKVIRASSLEIAEERAESSKTSGWIVESVRELDKKE
jgi:hypothetical protein